MKRPLIAAAIATFCLHLCGQAPRDPDAVLANVRAKLNSMTLRLPKYTCIQTVERSYFRRMDGKSSASSCDQISGDRKTGRHKLELYAVDRLRLDVAVSQGREIVSWAGAGRFDSRSIDEIVGDGPTGTGVFGGLLVDVFANPGVRFQYFGEKPVEGKTFLEYRFTVPLAASNYRIRGGTADWRTTAYDGTAQVDAQTRELDRLEIRTDELPPDTGMCEASTNLEYQHLKIGDGDFLLPRQGRLQILQTDTHETLSVTTFSGCREYHAESTIRFDDEAEGGSTATKPAAVNPVVLPEGLAFYLALTAPIDTDTAAAGDPVSARVIHAVGQPKSKKLLVPAGALVRGRITRMLHRVGGPNDFIVLISFDTLELGGSTSPFFVKLDSLDQLEKARMLSAFNHNRQTIANQGPETWGALLFPTMAKRYVVPAGFESRWLTVAPPAVTR